MRPNVRRPPNYARLSENVPIEDKVVLLKPDVPGFPGCLGVVSPAGDGLLWFHYRNAGGVCMSGTIKPSDIAATFRRAA